MVFWFALAVVASGVVGYRTGINSNETTEPINREQKPTRDTSNGLKKRGVGGKLTLEGRMRQLEERTRAERIKRMKTEQRMRRICVEEIEKALKEQEEKHEAATEEIERCRREQLELIQTQFDLYKQIYPQICKPTKDEIHRAEQRKYPDPQKKLFHCAIVGMSGSGKSSLINAFRGLKSNHPSAANIGVVETTLDITPYVHPRSAGGISLCDTPPQDRWVWYDVPGAGTLTVPGPQYFNAQGLFVFDLIILVVDNRFTALDIAILQQCKHLKIPTFIVRSKANQHINNIMHEELGYITDDTDAEENFESLLETAKQDFTEKTRANFMKNLEIGELDPKQHVYIVSAGSVCSAVNAAASGQASRRDKYGIDELRLLRDLKTAIVQRRGPAPSSSDDQDDS